MNRHLAMTVGHWVPTTADCEDAATYPQDAEAFHLFEVYVDRFQRAGDLGLAAADDLPARGCDSTGGSAPSLRSPLTWLARRRASHP